MITVTVLYPATEGARLDMDYYVGTHLPLVRRLMEPAGMRALTWWHPMEMGGPPPYRLVASLAFDDLPTAQAALAAHGAETQADIPSFTDIRPVILMGEERAG